MKTLARKAFFAALLATGLAFAGNVSADDKVMTSMPMPGHSEGSMQMHKIMADAQKMPMPMTGNVDKDFATMMTMHHRQALKMADVMIQHGRDAKLKRMAEEMKAAQQKEITELMPYMK